MKHGKWMSTGSWSGNSKARSSRSSSGILHNFANPLNGIIGRTRLLQRRLEEAIRKTREAFRRRNASFRRITRSCSRTSNSSPTSRTGSSTSSSTFREVLRYRDRNMQQVNISELVENEIRFFRFLPRFQAQCEEDHGPRRDLHDVSGSPADYSMFISTWVRYAMEAMRESPVKEFFVSTTRRNGHVILSFRTREGRCRLS